MSLTKDTKVKACRICLITEVKMFYIDSVFEYYISLLGNGESYKTFLNYICYQCASLLMKFVKFRKKYIAAQSILCHMQQECGGVLTEQDIKEINYSTLVLKSHLSYQKLPSISLSKKNNTTAGVILYEETTPDYDIKPDVFIKPDIEETEPDNDSQVLAEEEIEIDIEIKPELEKNEHDKSKSLADGVGVKREIVPSPAVEDQSDDDMPIISCIKPKERKKDKLNSQLEVRNEVQNRKRGQPRKRAATSTKAKQANPKRTKNNKKDSDDNFDLAKHVTIIKLSIEEQMEELNKRKQSSNYLNSPFQCHQCYRGFVHTHAWKHHLLKHDPSSGNLLCPICNIRFKKERVLKEHAKRNHEMQYICKSCSHISRREVQARLHQKWHDGVTYRCPHCDVVCIKWTSYLSHVRIKHPSEFICDVCGCSFISKLGLAMHKNKMHKDVTDNAEGDGETEPGPYCKECDIKFVSVEAWNRHMIISDKHKQTAHFKNLCRVCGKMFKSSEELQMHNKKEHRPILLKSYKYLKAPTIISWPVKCEHCSKEIGNAKQYWGHYRQMHPNENYPLKRNHEYICDICGKGFPTSTILIYHKYTHSEQPQFKCGTCEKAFYNRVNLQTHVMRTHSDARPYPCSLCSKAFKCKGALDRHFRCHTGAKPYTCELCGKSFSQSNSRKLHVNTVHLKQPAPPRAPRRRPPTARSVGSAPTATHVTPDADTTL